MKNSFLIICTSVLAAFLLSGTLYAQTTSIQLPTAADTNSSFRIINNSGSTILRLNADAGFYFGGTPMAGGIPMTGAGTRIMWFPGESAFRAGTVSGTQWDFENVGLYSMAMGNNVVAKGEGSIALGNFTAANNNNSAAIGFRDTANGEYAIAIGYWAKANGMLSTAIGPNAVATNFASSSFGNTTISSGSCATAMGNYVSTNNNQGAFIIGDYSTGTTITNSDTLNRMTMRFAGGYKLFTNSGCTLGAYLPRNATAWTVLCDRNRKENFRSIDGEQILEKIRTMPITEWNYKGTDPAVKYIGPVAQDFYAAFHLGGTDSLGINTLCIDGVNIAAIQALEKRTAELQRANEKIASIEKNNSEMQKRIEKLENIIASMTKDNDKQVTSSK